MPRRRSRAMVMAAGILALASCGHWSYLSKAGRVEAEPRIDPDYAGMVIPPNIAPLNFRILEEGRDCVVRISSEGAAPIELHCPDRRCRIGIAEWRRLLAKNKGKSLHYDVFLRQADGRWRQYAPFTNQVAEEPIDSHIVYRRLVPDNSYTAAKGLWQRDLEGFETSAILAPWGGAPCCYNCHTFCQNDPGRFFFHVRGPTGGTIFMVDGQIRKISTRHPPLSGDMAFASWHPDGMRVAASTNDEFRGFFPSTTKRIHFEAVAIRSDLVVYNLETNTLSTSPQLYDNGYIQTHPCWAADGKSLFYVRCRRQPAPEYKDLDRFRFELMRISYAPAADTWGEPDTLVECSKLGKSCTFPRASPDGRYLLCVLCDKTSFSVYQNSADLYLFDLESKRLRRLDAVNSDFADSFPCWSSNGRWFCFSSNRADGLTALPYFAYFDAHGREHKPFVLPQEDPGFYDTYTDSFNATQLVRGKVDIDRFLLSRAVMEPAIPARCLIQTHADAQAGPTLVAPGAGEPKNP